MTKEVEERLRREFPEVCEKLNRYGFECGDGWESLVREALEVLSTHGCVALQIKEKFGGLRVYYLPHSAEASEKLYEIEDRSVKTCDVCGIGGKIVGKNYWWRARCAEHEEG